MKGFAIQDATIAITAGVAGCRHQDGSILPATEPLEPSTFIGTEWEDPSKQIRDKHAGGIN